MIESLIPELRKSIINHNNIHPFIYSVKDGIVAKLNFVERFALNEYIIGRQLFRNGIQVPEMYGCISGEDSALKIEGWNPKIWYILMQEIKGTDYFNLNNKEWELAKPQYINQLLKISKLGIIAADVPQNLILDTKNNKLYFIDFEFWKKGTPEDIEKTYSWLNKYK